MSLNKHGKNDTGCLGCLTIIIVFWLILGGGCAKIEKLIDTQIAANEAKVASK